MRLIKPMKVCKICFKNFHDDSLSHLLDSRLNICKHCMKEIRAKFIKFDIDGIKALSIYDYDEKIQSLLYQFKGCFDIELRDVFLARYSRELMIKYHGYIIVPIPSYEEDDEIREFNHVVEIFKILNLQMLFLIKKTKRVKQATSGVKARRDISKYMELIDRPDLFNKKILLVDDVYTTGSTMKAAIDLVKQLHPKKIKVLVISKTKPE